MGNISDKIVESIYKWLQWDGKFIKQILKNTDWKKHFSVNKYRYSVHSLLESVCFLRRHWDLCLNSQGSFFRKNLSRIAIVSSIALQGNHINNSVSNQYKYQVIKNFFQVEFYTTKRQQIILRRA